MDWLQDQVLHMRQFPVRICGMIAAEVHGIAARPGIKYGTIS
jgi:hypothetical protein